MSASLIRFATPIVCPTAIGRSSWAARCRRSIAGNYRLRFGMPVSPLCGSIATMPEQKTIPPARIAGLW